MNKELWKSSTQNIFIGVLLYYLCDILGSLFGVLGMFSDFFEILGYVANAAVLVGAVMYFLGLKNFKDAVDENDKKDAGRIFTAIILLIIGAIVGFIPLFGWVGGILNIIAMVFMIMSYNRLKNSTTFPELAKKGASHLFISMIILIVATGLGWIPLAGGIIYLILSIIAVIFTFLGWKSIRDAVE